MNNSEENISNAESAAERRLFDALKREPGYALPRDFEKGILARIPKTESSRDVMWLTIGLVGFTLAAIIIIVLTGFKLNFGALKFISGYPGFIAFGIGFILFLQWVDRKLVRKASF